MFGVLAALLCRFTILYMLFYDPCIPLMLLQSAHKTEKKKRYYQSLHAFADISL